MISPSMSGVTLIHTETDTAPECRVVLGGGRLQANDKIDSRRIEVVFTNCAHSRASPKHDDYGLEREGFELLDGGPQGPGYFKWFPPEWRRLGYCPNSGFWVAAQSSWLTELSTKQSHHYVVCGRDGYVELIAERYSWREWDWPDGVREDAASKPPVASGSSDGPGA